MCVLTAHSDISAFKAGFLCYKMVWWDVRGEGGGSVHSRWFVVTH